MGQKEAASARWLSAGIQLAVSMCTDSQGTDRPGPEGRPLGKDKLPGM